ncbi:hypothetical protein LTR10_005658 [Elasticomyces elasticus]|nr:hypothetical protein LTR10_005658 [Elasticomyces elasticus]KAK4976397.1 hypothetical protein LTR42_004026 [Elasticomyces elasticus]
MAAPTTRTLITSTLCTRCHLRLPPTLRHFSTSPPSHASDIPDAAISAISNLSSSIARNPNRTPTSTTTTPRPGGYLAQLDRPAFLEDDDENSILTSSMRDNLNNASSVGEKPHRLHVYATKHNTHLTLVQPSRPASASSALTASPTAGKGQAGAKMIDVLMSYSAGNVGFRKAGRGSYDAAYQLAVFLFKQMGEKGLLVEKGIKGGIQDLEIVLRGFGAGREAVTKVLLGSEGRNVRGRVRRVVDATRLKLGGPRAKKPRRLG